MAMSFYVSIQQMHGKNIPNLKKNDNKYTDFKNKENILNN